MRAPFLPSCLDHGPSSGSSHHAGRERSRRARVLPAVLLLAVAPLFGGCGGVLYAVQATAANSKVEEARSLRADQQAPYEFYLAEEHMKKASEEASQANYGDAVELAERAEEAADKAIKLTRDALRGKGR